ncbi:acyl CoA:acetate/3-ketoacid CoA transferase [Nocardioides gansuensis]|uniref:Acyl CoA:acetate/3-ketoacid CoA transferase n=1 Tax=Nocardioides gansuensis TaxID=2138300 RepID=A0A2T8F7M2_9ACTN|nr:acyl CoA:acetate/3-ketoacid CoA transferase [Nocardioides gansuensis]
MRTHGAPLVVTAREAVDLIGDEDVVYIEGSGGGLVEPDLLLKTLGERFSETAHPRDLTIVHTTGIGDRKGAGMDHLAQHGLVARAIAGNWGMAPRMSEMAMENAFAAYNFPQGVMAQMCREIAGGRVGVITHVGLGTFCDPRVSGGRLNAKATEELVQILEIDGRELLHYRPVAPDVCFIRATTADADGNLSLEEEAARLEVLAMAQATHNSGGVVIAQVKRLAKAASLDPRTVVVPGFLVDRVVVHPEQRQLVETAFNPAYSGALRGPADAVPVMAPGARKLVGRRALMEIRRGDVVNLGVGIADGVASVAAEEGCFEQFTLTVEQGLVGGIPAAGVSFGASYNPVAILEQPAQFDFYDGGGLDVAFLGFAQLDRQGNVNVSLFNGRLIGTGGFINITQNAHSVVFCGTFNAGGLDVAIEDDQLEILAEGRHTKFVDEVEHVTFNGELAAKRGQRILVVTERAVFTVTDHGLRLIEVAPGIDPQTHVLDQIPFEVEVGEVELMDKRIFGHGVMQWHVPEFSDGDHDGLA